MSKKPSKFSRSPIVDDIDVDAIVAGADPVAVKAAQSERKKTEPKESKPRVTKKAPWKQEGIDLSKKTSRLVYLTEEELIMLKYIKTHDGISISHSLRTMTIDEIRKRAEKLFSERG